MESKERMRSPVNGAPQPDAHHGGRRGSGGSAVSASSSSEGSSLSSGSQGSSFTKVIATLTFCGGNPFTKRGQRIQKIQILTATAIPILVLFAYMTLNIYQNVMTRFEKVNTLQRIEHCVAIGQALHRLQAEEGLYMLAAFSSGITVMTSWKHSAEMETDAAFELVQTWDVLDMTDAHYHRDWMVSREAFIPYLNQLRRSERPVDEVEVDYEYMKLVILIWLSHALESARSTAWELFVEYGLLSACKEELSEERSRASQLFSTGNVTHSQFLEIVKHRYESEAYMDYGSKFSDHFDHFIGDLRKSKSYKALEHMRDEYMMNFGGNMQNTGSSRGGYFYSNSSALSEELWTYQLYIRGLILEDANNAIYSIDLGIGLYVTILFSVCIIAPLIIGFLSLLVKNIELASNEVTKATAKLRTEKKRTDYLLYQLLPKVVANKLKAGQTIKPEMFEEVSVFFSDVQGFTALSSESTPLQVVSMLNQLYETFDQHIDLYDVYKVETIGDGYMVASGVPTRNGKFHSREIANLALHLIESISGLRIPHLPLEHYHLRIGIHSGPCAAGVVGFKMPRYCLFGDTVNTASRMESTSEAQKIHISMNTYRALMFFNIYKMEHRGSMPIKGKGEMDTYWLLECTDPKQRKKLKLSTKGKGWASNMAGEGGE